MTRFRRNKTRRQRDALLLLIAQAVDAEMGWQTVTDLQTWLRNETAKGLIPSPGVLFGRDS